MTIKRKKKQNFVQQTVRYITMQLMTIVTVKLLIFTKTWSKIFILYYLNDLSIHNSANILVFNLNIFKFLIFKGNDVGLTNDFVILRFNKMKFLRKKKMTIWYSHNNFKGPQVWTWNCSTHIILLSNRVLRIGLTSWELINCLPNHRN